MIDFEPWSYRRIDDRLCVEEPDIDRPKAWTSSTRAVEETIETLLALNLPALTRLPLTFVRRAWAMDPSVDLVAVDIANRIHIFELKKASVGAQEASQIEQYLLGHVFADPDRFLESSRAHGRRQVEHLHTARYVAGAFANLRSSIVGQSKIIRELGPDHPAVVDPSGKPLTKTRYNRLRKVEQVSLIHMALERHAARKGIGPIPGLDSVLALASEHSVALASKLEHIGGQCIPRPRLVLWLVGGSIQPIALERVRLWRRAGVDARVLRAAARHIDGEWVLATRHELYGQRGELENQVWQRIETFGDPTAVRFSLYNTATAASGKRHGGESLDHPTAEIDWPDGRSTKLEI